MSIPPSPGLVQITERKRQQKEKEICFSIGLEVTVCILNMDRYYSGGLGKETKLS